MESRNSHKPFTEDQSPRTAQEPTHRHSPSYPDERIGSKTENEANASQQDINTWMRFRDKTQKEWCNFISGKENIDTSIIPPDVLYDWKRCREKKIDPMGIPHNPVLSEDDLQKRLHDNRIFIQISRPFLRRLFNSTRTYSSSVALFDPDGYLLEVLEDPRYTESNRRHKWHPGARWTDDYCGNNSIASVLKHQKPFQMPAFQHYLLFLQFVTASSAPVRNPDGVPIGGITLNCYYKTHPHSLDMTIATAGTVESALKAYRTLSQDMAAFHNSDIARGLQEEIWDSISEAMIAIDTMGRIAAANHQTQKLFGLDAENIKGKLLQDVCRGEENRLFRELIEQKKSITEEEVIIFSSGESHTYRLTCLPLLSSGKTVTGKMLLLSTTREITDQESLFPLPPSSDLSRQESDRDGRHQVPENAAGRDEENARTYLEWNKFIRGKNAVDATVVPGHILDAWKRCRNRRFDPLSKPLFNILEGENLQKLLKANENLIETSKAFLHQLLQVSKITNFSAALFDRDRFLLHVVHENQYIAINQKFHWHAGVQWTEEITGNNIIDSVMKLQKPLQIIGTQHYRKSLHYVTAAGAPVFDPDGEIIGGVALVTFLYISHPHTLGMAIAAAQAITNELRVQKALAQCRTAFDETDIASRLQKAIIASIPEGLITLNGDGRITAVNIQAQKMFGLENKEVIGKKLQEIYDGKENRAFLQLIDQQESVTDTEVRMTSPKGAGDYTLTCNRILSAVGSVVGKILVLSEIKRIKSLVNKFGGAKANLKFADIYGQNDHFKRIVNEAALISQSTSNVLLLGESGTGKDILAQAIHNASPRKDGPYIAINCAAIPRDLIASELFGYEEGAFTGSRRGGNQGKFELADDGTIFLDEIAETPLEIQAVLLRVIEDKCVVRVGGNQVRSVNVRIISATNRNLHAEVERGNFRKDLYYRLNVFNIHLPPLRERLDDIPILTEHFVKKYSAVSGKAVSGIDNHVMTLFMNYSWPGNVRELQNVIERMVNYASSHQLTPSLIPPEIIGKQRLHTDILDFESPAEAEKRLILHLINLKYRKKEIARQLNMSRANLYRKLAKYGLLETGKR